MKALMFIIVIAVVYYYGFYEKAPRVEEQSTDQQWPKPQPSLNEYSAQYSDKQQDTDAQPKKLNKGHALRGYQDQIQKAKDMEAEVLKAAAKQRKVIDGG